MKEIATVLYNLSLLLLLMMTMIQQCSSIGAYMEMIFNNGKAPLVSNPCTKFEESKIEQCFIKAGIRKLLRDTTKSTIQPQQDQREVYPLVCRDLCAGYVAKTCRAKRCVGFRRELEHEIVEHNDKHNSRNLNDELDMRFCNQTIINTNDCLDRNVLLSVSTSCKVFYNAKNRKASCRLFDKC